MVVARRQSRWAGCGQSRTLAHALTRTFERQLSPDNGLSCADHLRRVVGDPCQGAPLQRSGNGLPRSDRYVLWQPAPLEVAFDVAQTRACPACSHRNIGTHTGSELDQRLGQGKQLVSGEPMKCEDVGQSA